MGTYETLVAELKKTDLRKLLKNCDRRPGLTPSRRKLNEIYPWVELHLARLIIDGHLVVKG